MTASSPSLLRRRANTRVDNESQRGRGVDVAGVMFTGERSDSVNYRFRIKAAEEGGFVRTKIVFS
jgi:hypothetical protein